MKSSKRPDQSSKRPDQSSKRPDQSSLRSTKRMRTHCLPLRNTRALSEPTCAGCGCAACFARADSISVTSVLRRSLRLPNLRKQITSQRPVRSLLIHSKVNSPRQLPRSKNLKSFKSGLTKSWLKLSRNYALATRKRSLE